MCKGAKALIFQSIMVAGLWKILRNAFPIAVQWPHRVRISKLQIWRWWDGGDTKPSQTSLWAVSWCSFPSLLSFPMGALRKMKEAECTWLGGAVRWNPIPSLEAPTETARCAASLCGPLRLLREGRPQLQDQSQGLRPAPGPWPRRPGCLPSGYDLLLSPSVP